MTLKSIMRLLKTHPILGLVNSYLIDSPQPSNLSYAWNGGSLLGLCLITQLATGIFLAMHYIASADLAFISVESKNIINILLASLDGTILTSVSLF